MDRVNAQGSGAPNKLRLVASGAEAPIASSRTPRAAAAGGSATSARGNHVPRVIEGVDTVELSGAVVARIRPNAGVGVAAESVGSSDGAEARAKVSRLVAGKVSTPVHFEPQRPAPPAPGADRSGAQQGSSPGVPAAYALHRSPTERNTAATGVAVGRSLDVTA